MSPPEPSYLTTAGPEKSNIAEAQEKYLKSSYMKTEVIKKEGISPLKNIVKYKQAIEGNK